MAVIAVLAGLAYATQAGWFGGRPDPDLLPDDGQDRRVIELQVTWMERVPDETVEGWDPEWEEEPTTLLPGTRELTITYYLDEEAHPSSYDTPGTWNEFLAVPAGTRVRLLVEEVGPSPVGEPFKQCTIFEGTRMVAYEHRNDRGDCDVRWTAGR